MPAALTKEVWLEAVQKSAAAATDVDDFVWKKLFFELTSRPNVPGFYLYAIKKTWDPDAAQDKMDPPESVMAWSIAQQINRYSAVATVAGVKYYVAVIFTDPNDKTGHIL